MNVVLRLRSVSFSMKSGEHLSVRFRVKEGSHGYLE